MTLATRVRALDVFGPGISYASPNKLGFKIAGHSSRRNKDAVIKRVAIRGRLQASHRLRKTVNTSCISEGKYLKRNQFYNL